MSKQDFDKFKKDLKANKENIEFQKKMKIEREKLAQEKAKLAELRKTSKELEAKWQAQQKQKAEQERRAAIQLKKKREEAERANPALKQARKVRENAYHNDKLIMKPIKDVRLDTSIGKKNGSYYRNHSYEIGKTASEIAANKGRTFSATQITSQITKYYNSKGGESNATA